MRQADSFRSCLALLAVLALSACGPRGTPGIELPPTEFGALSPAGKACAAVVGSFSWEARDPLRRSPNDFRSLPNGSGILPLGPATQLWITRGDGDSLVLRTRLINRNPNYSTREARDWRTAIYKASRLECEHGLLAFAPIPVASAQETANWGGSGLSRGFRLGLLQDGSLALGLQNVVTNRMETLIPGTSLDRKAADRVTWEWHRLPRIADGAREPAPVDTFIR